MEERKTEDAKELSPACAEGFDHYDGIVFNPNVFTEFKLEGSPEVFSYSYIAFIHA